MLKSHNAIFQMLVGIAIENKKLITQLGQLKSPICQKIMDKHNLTEEDFVALCRSAYAQSLTKNKAI